ncbi:hypothetical protein IFM89_029935 [Coptis chinensis]|uniref:Uncharacterized protein n=1 Tax=Coptis chinensis TaxID=261450 RepID=A0A835HDW3_9MAGN|nr:hypothetical protein IFM89_029935 [Coptis chinensis]
MEENDKLRQQINVKKKIVEAKEMRCNKLPRDIDRDLICMYEKAKVHDQEIYVKNLMLEEKEKKWNDELSTALDKAMVENEKLRQAIDVKNQMMEEKEKMCNKLVLHLRKSMFRNPKQYQQINTDIKNLLKAAPVMCPHKYCKGMWTAVAREALSGKGCLYIGIRPQPSVISSLDAHNEEGLHRGLRMSKYLEARQEGVAFGDL